MTPDARALDRLLAGTTPAQREAITHREGPLLVLAGAGSGKTLVITRRLAYLVLAGVPPAGILAVTFTRKAAREMKERIRRYVPAPDLWVSTFHGFAARVLRREIERLGYPRTFVIYDDADRQTLMGEVLKELDLEDGPLTPAAAAAQVSRLKNVPRTPAAFAAAARTESEKTLGTIYARYEESLRRAGALDFDDLLLKLLLLWEEHPEVLARWRRRFPFLLVDEYQDTNVLQYRLVKLLGEAHRNVCVTGDPDQAIYTWRGADLRNILSFERDFPDAHVVKLERNFRSVGNILKAADAVIAHNVARKEKRLYTDAPPGDKLLELEALDEEAEADLVVATVREHLARGGRRREAAVFYRTNALSRPLERAFLQAGIPYDVVGTVSFYERREVKDLLAYLRLAANPADAVSLMRILNVPPRGIGARTVETLRRAAEERGVGLHAVVTDPAAWTSLRGPARGALTRFRAFLAELAARREGPVGELLAWIVERIEYLPYLRRQGDGREEERVENVQELLAHARAFTPPDEELPPLHHFLEEVALVSQIDLFADEEDRVSLMTIHNAKGLEFDLVVVTGVEEGLLPHARSVETGGTAALEEERRLFYVALTRARRRVVLTRAAVRGWGGAPPGPRLPSRFLGEIPPAVLERRVAAWPEAPAATPAPRAGPPAPELEPGQLVRHEIFGIGRVVRVEGHGPGRKARIRFQTAGERLLVLAYAGLTLVD